MKHINIYINEAWSGVKKQSLKPDIEAWCDEMGIENYTINSQNEIDVKGNVNLSYKDFKELPYKFGNVTGYFDIGHNGNLTSLKNCPNHVNGDYFSCKDCNNLKTMIGCPSYIIGNLFCNWCENLISLEGCPKEVGGIFYCNGCKSLNSLEGCPKRVGGRFACGGCKRNFTKKEVRSLCKVSGIINLK